MAENNKLNVLIIDDENDNSDLIEQILSDKFKVHFAVDGEEGLVKARKLNPDVILLDIGLPKIDGLTLCDQLRTNELTKHIPIIMLTASNESDTRIKAFTSGADDYISKPYKPKELIARVLSKVRRLNEQKKTGDTLICGNLTLNLSKLEATVDTKVIDLSLLEFNLLKYLVENKDRVLSREKILQTVWKDAVVSDRTVDTHMVSLRKRLNGFDHTLSTVYGAGYILKKE